MRHGAVLLTVLALAATAALPGMALAAGDHGTSDAPNPLLKSVLLFLDGAGGLATSPAAPGAVPAAPAGPDGTSTPAVWSVSATKNTALDSSVFVDVFARVDQATIVAGGPDGAAFQVQLAKNGAPVEGASGLVKVASGLLQPDTTVRLKLFIPQVELAFAPGDTFELWISFYGLNPEQRPAVSYLLGGEEGSRLAFRLKLAGLQELDLPKEVGAWPVTPLQDFHPEDLAKKDPGATHVTLKAFQFGFHGAPVVVPNGTRVVLHLYVDESLSGSAEGHAGHGHAEGGPTGGVWDQSPVTALHGFSLASYDPKLTTVLFDGLVVSVGFTADRPGNYTFLCTVFCGSGHGLMLDRLQVTGPEGLDASGASQAELGPGSPAAQGAAGSASTPGPVAALAVLVLAGAALAARRRT